MNYGGIGAVIGHEIGHGFDDQGSKYDGDGNMSDWWTDADRKEFEKRAKMLIDQYNGLVPREPPRPARQRRADDRREHRRPRRPDHRLKAYRIALADERGAGDRRPHRDPALLHRLGPGLAHQYRDAEAVRRLAIDPHSPDRVPLQRRRRNLDEFYDAFDVRPGDALYTAPEHRVRIW